MNVLILSCGTRCLLVDYFMNRENGFDKVVVTDCSEFSPALYRADKYYIVPRMYDATYLPTLFDICKVEDIDVVLPLQEDELKIISEKRDEFGIRRVLPVISELELVELCKDKYLLYRKMQSVNIPAVPTFTVAERQEIIDTFEFPIFIKPRYGAGSVANHVIYQEDTIDGYIKNESQEFVLQPYMEGQEYGVNAYVDFISRKLAGLFILKKIRMRAGETEKSESVHDIEIRLIVEKICQEFSLVGPIDIDIIKKDGKYYVLEINPRFGGGYPHTHECGVNFVKMISNNARGIENIPYEMDYEDGVVAFRYMTISTIRKTEMIDGK